MPGIDPYVFLSIKSVKLRRAEINDLRIMQALAASFSSQWTSIFSGSDATLE
jgi:hypothetical protein